MLDNNSVCYDNIFVIYLLSCNGKSGTWHFFYMSQRRIFFIFLIQKCLLDSTLRS